MTGKISPSLMCADFKELQKQIREMERAGVDYFHCDVMDGVFVPNYSLGTDFVRMMHDMTKIPLDIHLMVINPERAVDMFDVRKGDILSFHYETCTHVQRTLRMIRDRGAKAGLALNPATPLNMLEYTMEDIDVLLVMTVNPGFAGQKMIPSGLRKIEKARQMIQKSGCEVAIEADGNVSFENAVKMSAAGTDIFVAGTSAIFREDMTIDEAVKKMRECIR